MRLALASLLLATGCLHQDTTADPDHEPGLADRDELAAAPTRGPVIEPGLAPGGDPVRARETVAPDRAEIEYVSRGCFGGTSFSITIFRDRPYASVTTEDGRAWLALSVEDLAGIDRLFDFYRSDPRGGCTTIDDVAIRWFRGDAKVAAEHYTDGSCLMLTFRTNDRLSPEDQEAVSGITITLGDLVRRAEAD